ncbi:MAG: hypothetical protein ACRDHF_09440 [Tepidiformaceae bacterium]
MTGVRYWLAAVLVLGGLGLAGVAAANWRDWPMLPAAGAAVLAGGAGLIIGFLPPGRPRFRSPDFQRRHTEPLWPYLPGTERPQFTRYQMDAAVADERRGATYVGLAMAAMIMGIGMAAVAVSLFAAARSQDIITSQVDRFAGLSDHTPEATAEPATATPEPPTATLTPTPEPPTPTATPTQRPAVRKPSRPSSTPSPTAPPRSQEQVNISMAGRWKVTDRVDFGTAAGETFTFDITLRQEGDRVFGSGNGMSFEGRLQDEVLTILFTRPGGFGIFVWNLLPDGSFSGDWHDFTAQNGGPSTLAPIP